MRKVISSILTAFRRFFGEDMTAAELEVQLGMRPSADSKITIVALTQREQDCEVLSRLAAKHDWTVHSAKTWAEASKILDSCRAQIFLCDRALPGIHWSDALQMAISSGQSMYLILVSKRADDYLWNEVIRWGGHDLLSTPLKDDELLRAIRFGWSYWKCAMRVPSMAGKQ